MTQTTEDAKELLDELEAGGIAITVTADRRLRFSAPVGAMTEALKQRVRLGRESLITLLDGAQSGTSGEATFPTTDIQAAYLLGRTSAFADGSTGCHGYTEFILDPSVLGPPPGRRARLDAAWAKVVACHPMLRAQFTDDGSQFIASDLKVPVQFRGAEERQEVRGTLRGKQYPVSGGPLIDLVVTTGDDNWVLHLSVDLLISDFSGLATIVADLDRALRDPGAVLERPRTTFEDYQRLLAADPGRHRRQEEDRRFWAGRVPTMPDPLVLSSVCEPGHDTGYRRLSGRLGSRSWAGLRAVAAECAVTPTALLVALTGRILHRYGKGTPGVIAMTLSRREPVGPDVERIVGDFTSTILVELPGGHPTLRERTCDAHAQIFEAMSHGAISGVEIARMAARARGAERFVTPIVITSTIGMSGRHELGALRQRHEVSVSQTPQVLLDCQFSETQGGLAVDWDCRADGFDPHVLAAAFDDLVATIEGVARDAALPEADLTLRAPAPTGPASVTRHALHEPFWNLARHDPHAVALVEKNRTVTRGQLSAGAATVARWLTAQKGTTSLVVDLGPGAAQLAAHLGALVAGMPYIPVEPDWPSARRDDVVAQVRAWHGAPAILSAASPVLADVVAALEGETTVPPDELVQAGPDAPAYVIFTSGSTGHPKGVVVTHRQAATTLDAMVGAYHIGADDAVLAVSRHSFDLSVFNEFGVLGAGGRVVVPPDGLLTDPQGWLTALVRHEVTVWNSVPAQLDLVLGAWDRERTPVDALRLVLVSGDWVPVEQPGRVEVMAPGARFVALGGATEAAIWSVAHEVNEPVAPATRSIPYGRALPGQSVWVLNADDEPAVVGQVGEIVIAGGGVADGYAASPELTAAAFFRHPRTGERCYRTGDLGRLMASGEVEFLGRRDGQVKIRGHRIELREIEAVLEDDPRIERAAAGVDSSGVACRIVAGVVSHTCSPDDRLERVVTPSLRVSLRTAHSDRSILAGVDLHRRLDELAVHHMLRVLAGAAGSTASETVDGPPVLSGRHALRWIRYLEASGLLATDDRLPRSADVPSADQLSDEWQRLTASAELTADQTAVLGYVQSCFDQLEGLLDGSVDPLELLFPRGDQSLARATYRATPAALWGNAVVAGVVAAAVAQLAEDGERARILEIGAGTGATTEVVLDELDREGHEVDYMFTDISRFFLDSARERWPRLETALFDINRPAGDQGLPAHSADIVLAANVLHNSRDIAVALARVAELLEPSGLAVIIDSTSDSPLLMTTMEFKEGLPQQPDDARAATGSPFLTIDQWRSAIDSSPLRLVDVAPGEGDVLGSGHQHVFVLTPRAHRARVTPQIVRGIAAARLPRYMVPDAVAVLDAIPLSPNGKVDRSAIAQGVRPVGGASRQHESGQSHGLADKNERIVARVWQEVLGLPDAAITSPRDDFFDMGGDSLLLARCVAQLRREMPDGDNTPWDAALRAIVADPTIAGCAAAFAGPSPRHPGAAGTPVVPLSDAERWPGDDLVVLVHDGSGGLEPYDDLVRALADRPHPELIGLRRVPGDGFSQASADRRLETLAARYQTALTPGDRPVHLVGYCLGGLVAASLAARLSAAGRTVASTTVVSSYRLPFVVRDDLLIDYAFAKVMGRDPAQAGIVVDDGQLGHALRTARQDHVTEITEQVLAEYGEPPLRLALGAAPRTSSERLTAMSEQWPGMTLDGVRSVRDSVAASFEAVAAWQPLPYLGDIDFLRQNGPLYFLPGLADDMTDFWSDHCLGTLRVRDIAGTHFDCLRSGQTAGAAEILDGIWRRR
ncbi:pyochelin synthetase [Propionibacterium cyclohexanicum]|uniref:Pyochelin synthetase n=1 Tax=Propionibacterium cyclohexanicum TaxID=64702 RepID=A0A1H9RSJ1_9ACTN|nr:non-ribosomal peptide synthetase [Propionibacterium cyclohexanicum]SER75800.1 pyochelin synthetase [Propionibacterium cyclohexanicum]